MADKAIHPIWYNSSDDGYSNSSLFWQLFTQMSLGDLRTLNLLWSLWKKQHRLTYYGYTWLCKVMKTAEHCWCSGPYRKWGWLVLYGIVKHLHNTAYQKGSNVWPVVATCVCSDSNVILLFISDLQSNYGNKTNISLKWVTDYHNSTDIFFFLIWHNGPIDDDQNGDLYTSTRCLTCFVYVLFVTSQLIAQCIVVPGICYQLLQGYVKNNI